MIDVERFVEIQNQLSRRLSLSDRINPESVKLIGGVDCTFVELEGITLGISCITILDRDFNLIEFVYGKKLVEIPYIPTFLAFREVPVVMEAYKSLRNKPDVFIFDGQGILHPRKMGIASHFGVITDTITVGCGKSHLYGKYNEPENLPLRKSPVYVDGELRGYALRVKKNTNPIFISPGNNISLDSSFCVIINSLKGYKLPEPVRMAHNLLKDYRKKIVEELR